MLTRRDFLKASLAGALSPVVLARRVGANAPGTWVNDVHSRLNRTHVADVLQPASTREVQDAIENARSRGQFLSVAGARHAAGGQQFASGAPLLDLSRMSRIRSFDPDRGIVDVEAGARWPEIEEKLRNEQGARTERWCVAQKQGVPLMSLGGTLSANAHGNTVGRGPIISDVESFELVDARGRVRRCSRSEHPDLFRLAIGGYGLFGVITSVRPRLVRARMVETVAELVRMQDIPTLFERHRAAGMLHAEFQFATDSRSEDFLRSGILVGRLPAERQSVPSTPEPSTPEPSTPEPGVPAPGTTQAEWLQLVHLAHLRPGDAFHLYADRLLAGSGKRAWSDEPSADTVYVPGYHEWLDQQPGASVPSSEVLMEFFMPPDRIPEFLERARAYFLEAGTRVIFGTIRFCERDAESFLSWAPEPRGCVVFNLHTEHTSEGVAATRKAFQSLVEIVLSIGGTYYLTYNRFATAEQVERCYTMIREFLRQKVAWDPEERFQSDWYRDYKAAFASSPRTR